MHIAAVPGGPGNVGRAKAAPSGEPLRAPTPQVDLTVVVPTFNEGGNVEELVRRLATACEGMAAEVLFVDDSTDDTPDVVRRVAGACELSVRLVHRAGEQATGGLSGAVVRGLREARGDWVVVMDGDLQHPPELVPVLLEAAEADGADVVVASRYCGESDASGLSGRFRRSVSSGSTLLARSLFPRRVGRVCSDPMTGYFLLRREAVDLDLVRPRGFKILLELLARHDLEVREVPFVFGERSAGQSKASWRQGARFLQQLAALRFGRMAPFALVGLTGVAVNLAAMALAMSVGLHYVAASLLSTELAIVWNFVLLERIVFADLRDGVHSLRARVLRTLLFNNVENLARIPFLVLLVGLLQLPGVLAQGVLIGIAFLGRYLYMTLVVYRPRPVPSLVPDTAPVAERTTSR